jgi:hypothetical protein
MARHFGFEGACQCTFTEGGFFGALGEARKVSGCPKICKLAHAFMWEYSDEMIKLAQLLGQLGVFFAGGGRRAAPSAGLRLESPVHPTAMLLRCIGLPIRFWLSQNIF